MNESQGQTTLRIAHTLTKKFVVKGRLRGKNYEDIIGDCCLKVSEEFHKYDESKAKFSTWAYRVIMNFLIDVKRSGFKKPKTVEYVEFSTTTAADRPYNDDSGPPGLPPAYCQDGHWTASPDKRRDYEDLIKEVSRLARSDDELHVLIAVSVDNASFEECARELGCTRQWANQLYLNVTERIRRCGKHLQD